MTLHRYKNREEAGALLARHLHNELSDTDLTLVALPRGGIVIASEIAKKFGIPINLLIVRKLGVPEQPELAMGAISSGGYIYLNDDVIDSLGISPEEITTVQERERRELTRREREYGLSEDRPLRSAVEGNRVLIIDDGVATGATMKVALRALKAMNPRFLAIAVPVATLSFVEEAHRTVDAVYTLQTPPELGAVGEYYEDFSPVDDGRVLDLLGHGKAMDR